MDPRLANQENSGEAEMEMMRQDLEAARARYDEDQHGDVMDETPQESGESRDTCRCVLCYLYRLRRTWLVRMIMYSLQQRQ